MSHGIVESNEEMKEKMKKIKKQGSETKDEIKNKAGEVKETASEKKEEAKVKAGEITDKAGEVKKAASEKTEEAKVKADEIKNEAAEKKKELEKESEAEGMSPAEKIVNDVIKGFKQSSDEINKTLAGYAKEYKTPKHVEKPLVDVLENNDTVYLIADIPEVKKEDLELNISKNSVEISANFSEDNGIEKNAKFIQKERNYGNIKRTIELPVEIKTKNASAKFKGSMLVMTLPKAEKDITKIKVEGD